VRGALGTTRSLSPALSMRLHGFVAACGLAAAIVAQLAYTAASAAFEGSEPRAPYCGMFGRHDAPFQWTASRAPFEMARHDADRSTSTTLAMALCPPAFPSYDAARCRAFKRTLDLFSDCRCLMA